MEKVVPLYGRMIHDQSLGTSPSIMPYGTKEGEALNSINRKDLNDFLLTSAEDQPNIKIYFKHKLTKIDFEKMTLKFSTPGSDEGVTVKHDFIFGCDGAHSTVRGQMMEAYNYRLNYSQECIEHGYKELVIPPNQAGDFAIEPNYLHIWPKGDFVMIAFPNLDHSFTISLFMPTAHFEKIKTREDIVQLFQDNFPDALAIIGEDRLVKDFQQNPIGSFLSVKCSLYHFEDKCLLLGDAAHAMVPFFGQGVNCGFEDCLVFSELFEQFNGDFSKIGEEYSLKRVKDAHAICDLSMGNYLELRSHVKSHRFMILKKMETLLTTLLPGTFMPLHSMVSFTRIPYQQTVLLNARKKKLIHYGMSSFFLVNMLIVFIIVFMFHITHSSSQILW